MQSRHSSSAGMRRRELLATTVTLLFAASTGALAETIRGAMPWTPDAGDSPSRATPGGWVFFTPEEAAAVEAVVDRLIPPDPETPGGKEAGVAVFIDRQLAGPFGSSAGLWMRPPFANGTPEQGPQSPVAPAGRYRQSLAALDRYCRQSFAGKPFNEVPDDQKDKILAGLEKGEVQLDDNSGRAFFNLLLQNTKEGFFADPIYGGNRDMCGWRMIGFPGARYDYRDWVERHNERYPHPPVSIAGRPEWTRKGI